jgi:hypothetical protein
VELHSSSNIFSSIATTEGIQRIASVCISLVSVVKFTMCNRSVLISTNWLRSMQKKCADGGGLTWVNEVYVSMMN